MLYQPPTPKLPEVRLISKGLPSPLGGEHHGGAWKVAYADFVTALLCLFIVLWLMGSTTKVKQSVSGYFHDPRGYSSKRGGGPANAGEGLKVNHSNVSSLQQQLEQALRQSPDFDKIHNNVRFSVTGEGLRIDLMETERGMFFVTGQPAPTPAGEHLLDLLGAQIGKLPNQVVIEGHTDSQPFRTARPASGYGNWELAADRANAARRLLHQFSVRPEQVVEVRGFADQKLLFPDANDPRNRRVSLVVKFQ